MLKNFIKRIIIFFIIIVLIWLITFTINFIRCINYKKPIPILSIGGGLHDTYDDEYNYIGYTIKTHSYYGKIMKAELTLLNNKLVETDLIKPNRKSENAKLEVLKNSISPDSITICITDSNEFTYNWLWEYDIEKKSNDNWRKIKFEEDYFAFIHDIEDKFDENNQVIIEIDWSKQYEQLSTGTYRIVKEVFDESHGYVDIYSNEFEIVK